MAGSGMDEKKSIRDSARTLKKYGSTSNHLKRQEHFVKHIVTETDTLQGIALKYGVTTEQIRRANRLWANDSLFLRETLLIPVPSDSLSSPSEVLLFEPQSQSQPISPSTPENNGVENNYSDFLLKIDSAIANTKSQVMLAQGNSEFRDEDPLFVRRKAPMSRLKQQQQQQHYPNCQQQTSYQQYQQPMSGYHSNNTSTSSICSDVPVVMTQGRKVRSSLQRLERQQDEMFEL
ncbi:lysM peptidoglycan-binding domain-containing protein red [Lycorma delicatula]|uniref:lysM peptidoglycan-binding domain-containing protein red n=1 Tax=Lycorma delicatula TaxID=130591 RepID=UPI003F5130BD